MHCFLQPLTRTSREEFEAYIRLGDALIDRIHEYGSVLYSGSYNETACATNDLSGDPG
jgi:hypothetical protein